MPVTPTTTNTHVSPNFGALLEPGLRKIFFQTYAEIPEQFSKIFNVNTSKKATETDYQMGAFGDWEERVGAGGANEVAPVAYDKIKEGDKIVYTHKAFTKGFQISRELYDDDQYRQMAKMPAAMARAGRAFVEKQAATVLHNAFGGDGGTVGVTHLIYDGKPLCATDHPLIDNDAVTGVNVITGALTDVNLKKALTIAREVVDEAGNIIASTPKMLIVPPSLEFTAKTLVNSTLTAGTNNNDINTIKGALEVFVYDYIGEAAGGSDTAWFILDKDISELNFFWRVKPEFKQTEDFDTFVSKYRGYMRFSYGVSDWRGIVGSTGL